MRDQRKICVADSDLCDLETYGKLFYDAGFSTSTFQTGRELLDELDAQQPCCLVVDAGLSDLNPLALLQCLAHRRQYVPVILIANQPEVPLIVAAIKAGAVDFLSKPVSDEMLLAAVCEALQRHTRATQDLAAQERIQNRFRSLTQRESEIFKFVVTGMLNKQVAGQLGISEKTVKAHRGRVMKKLGVQSIAELVRLSEELKGSGHKPAAVAMRSSELEAKRPIPTDGRSPA